MIHQNSWKNISFKTYVLLLWFSSFYFFNFKLVNHTFGSTECNSKLRHIVNSVTNQKALRHDGQQFHWLADFGTLCLYKKVYLNCSVLTLFPSGPGHYGPYYHESVCCYPMVGGRFPKIHDFGPFAICQDLKKLLLTFFTKKFEKLAIKNFQGSLSIRWKMKKIEKFFFWN